MLYKVLLLTDKPNWAYDSIAQSLIKYNANKDVSLHIVPIKGNLKRIKRSRKKYDAALVMGWQCYKKLGFLLPDATLIGVHSHHSWDKRKTTPDKDVDPPKTLIRHLNRFKRVNVVSARLYDLFRKNGVKRIFKTINGADTELFRPPDQKPDKFYVGFSGTDAHDWRKGITGLIIPASKKAGVNTKLAMRTTKDYVPLSEMPQFYQQLSCYVCASLSEGFSLSVLEAAATGLPIISTKVSGCTELIEDGENGFLVDRDVDQIADKIRELKDNKKLYNKISKNIRQTIEEKYSWEKRTPDWIDFLTMGLG